MAQSLAALCIGFILDFILGDPHSLWHPVQGIGSLITGTEKALRKVFPDKKRPLQIAGLLLVLFVASVSVLLARLLLWIAERIHPALGFGLSCVLCWQMLAAKSLKAESMKVYAALEKEGLEAGRRAVSMIVGRDTKSLSEEGVIKATVETVAENTSDGVTAPLFYMMLAGPLGGVFYKAVNTMDSMIGYRSEKYRWLGTCAARLDDIVNFIPARISALFMTAAAFVLGFDGKGAWNIYRRDRHNHKSPNAAQTEAVMAGALQVQLAGDAWYFGELYKKPTIGDPIRPVRREDIPAACRLEYGAVILQFLAMAAVKAALIFLI